MAEGRSVAQRLTAQAGVVAHDARQLSVVVVVIDLGREFAMVRGQPEQVQFAVSLVHAAVGTVLATRKSAVLQREGIVVLRVGIFAAGHQPEFLSQVPLVTQEGTDIAKRAHFHLRCEPLCPLAVRTVRGLDRQERWGGCLTGWQEEVIVVAYGQLQALHLVDTIARQVYLAALTLAEHHAVIAHARMTGTEASHRHRLHAARTAIVAQRNAWQTVERFAHVADTLSEQLVALQLIGGRRAVHRAQSLRSPNLNFAEVEAAGGILLLC